MLWAARVFACECMCRECSVMNEASACEHVHVDKTENPRATAARSLEPEGCAFAIGTRRPSFGHLQFVPNNLLLPQPIRFGGNTARASSARSQVARRTRESPSERVISRG